MAIAVADRYERTLAREGLSALDFDDGAGGIAVGNRGSGKTLGGAHELGRRKAWHSSGNDADLSRRKEILGSHRFRKGERRIYALYAEGIGTRVIAKKIGRGRMAVFRVIKRIERTYRAKPERTVGELLRGCDSTTIIFVFALLERALEEPQAIREVIGQARAVPEIRAILEPDEVKADG